MYKLLIVDDEEWIRIGIKERLAFCGFHFTWIEEASSGEEALEMVKAFNPDILIADINMMEIDGIQLIKQAKELCSGLRFVIISAHAKFEYAEQALDLGVLGYLLKPVSTADLTKVMQKVISNLDNEKKIHGIIYDNNILHIERSVNHLLLPDVDAASDAVERFYRLSNTTENYRFLLGLVHISQLNVKGIQASTMASNKIKSEVKRLFSESSGIRNALVMDSYKNHSEILLLIYCKQDDDIDKTREDFYRLLDKNQINIGPEIELVIAFSSSRIGMSNELYRQAKSELELVLMKKSKILSSADAGGRVEKIGFPQHKFELLQKCIISYDLNNIKSILKDIFTSVQMDKKSATNIRFLFKEVIDSILKAGLSLNINVGQLMSEEVITGDIVVMFANIDELVKFLHATIIEIFKGEKTAASGRNLIDRIGQYIEKEFSRELSVGYLANEFALTPNYLSMLFKQKTGESITSFINKVRVDKACELLLNTKIPAGDIGQSVGYSDALYFFKVFKKLTGITPGEYRNNKGR